MSNLAIPHSRAARTVRVLLLEPRVADAAFTGPVPHDLCRPVLKGEKGPGPIGKPYPRRRGSSTCSLALSGLTAFLLLTKFVSSYLARMTRSRETVTAADSD